MGIKILCIVGPTASGKSSRAVEEALKRDGEIISVDSRQVYRGLDIGTEKITREEMRGVPHHLIDIRNPDESYSAGDFVADATCLIKEISARGKLPILVGGTHFYFDALLKGVPPVPPNEKLRERLEALSNEQLLEQVSLRDPERAGELDPKNRRRLIRALEIIASLGAVPPRYQKNVPIGTNRGYVVEWIVIDHRPEGAPSGREELRTRIDARLKAAFARGLIDEVHRVRGEVGDARLNELGLEYRIVGEHLRAGGAERSEVLLPALSAKLWQYARHQKAWLRKLQTEIMAYSSI
ncbi:tRNA (adenosine(37)-N6)-dimethylallyltransferase MiaA [Candidatus Kaiserbacteria bacterium]|nr:tRNA (adenosine(37)-N6)-dimethylallyltransferase MiaA [Candidatus Kaiserbacteria bacterium]